MDKICWVPQPINSFGIRRLEENNFSVLSGELPESDEILGNIVAAIFRSGKFTCTMMEQLPALRIIAVHGVGTDGIDIASATRKNIVVLNTPGMNSRSVAEHALSLLLDLAKCVTVSDRAIRKNQYTAIKYSGGFREIFGLTLGIIGYGAIGQHLAIMAAALGMNVLIHSSQSAESLADKGMHKAENLEELLGLSDFVSLHAPATANNRHLINRERLALMKPGSFLINTSRGALVDEQALADALSRGHLAGAGLDVFENEPLAGNAQLLNAPNLIVTPHSAASTESAMRNMAMGAVEGILDVLNNRLPASLVNPGSLET